MSDEYREALEREKARLLEEAAAKQAAAEEIDHDLAEIDRLATKYPHLFAGNQASAQKDERQTVDRTVASLITNYKADPQSSYQHLRYRTRQNYDSLMKRILEEQGAVKLIDLKEPKIKALYDGWSKTGMTQAHSLVAMLRQLVNYGATNLADEQCVHVSFVLRNMHFESPKARNEALTQEQAAAIIEKAHQMRLHSIALGQAFQFNCKLKQRDVIGEWVPIEEKTEPSDIIDKSGSKWVRGLRWSEIDDLVLHHTVSHNGKVVELRLSEAPMVMAEFRRIRAERGGTLPQSGPIIVREYDGLPWSDYDYRRAWRKVARACAIPDNVYNMDNSRASAGDEKSPVVEVAR
jgi:hypothetical protein